MNPTVMKLAARTHTFWYRVSGGILGSKMGKAPILLLTTTGRKSGRKITTPLQYIEDGDNVVLIASNAGHKVHPQWWLNIAASPQVEVQIKGDRKTATAAAAEGEERTRLWQKAVDQYAGYDDYKETADREIPVVVVTPSGN
jgi:deazaflavin-dependent oxidoreductase (nitroreductase family)